MPKFNLSIQITPGDTKTINRQGFKVAIAKGNISRGGPILVWALFSPFTENLIVWDAIYGVYASPDSIQQPESKIFPLFGVYPANPGVVYTFSDNGFDPASSGLPIEPGNYAVQNKTSGPLTFGLAQTVMANDSTFNAQPTYAISLLTQQTGLFAPFEIISVFLYDQSQGGIITTYATLVVLNMHTNPTQTIHYNGLAFVPGPLQT